MPVSTPNGYLDFTNATPRATKVIATSNIGVGTSDPIYSLDVMGTANVGALTATTLSVTNTPLATIAANLVTYNSSTGLFQDSGGLFSNKLAVVSEQPPSGLTGASTTITNHGVYKVTASTGTAYSAFDKSAGTSWTASSDYTGGSGTGVYVPGTARLHTSTVHGDWIALEFPYKTTLRHLTFTGNIEKANLYATNDGGITWTELKNWESGETTVVVNASENYKKYGLVTTKTTGSATLSLTELRFFTESFAIDGGKVAMASGAITGGNTVMDQTGPHARHVVPLRKYPEVNMQDYRQGGYTASASADQNIDRAAAGYDPIVSRSAWAAFNGSETSGFWQLFFTDYPYDTTEPYDANTNAPIITDVDNVDHRGHWIKLELPHKIKVQKMTTNHGDQPERYDSVILLGSNDDTNWHVIKDTFTLPVTSFTSTEINSDTAYKYILLLIKSLGTTDDQVDLYQLEYYGYEETSDPDTSVDTKITSQFNLPDTTGVKLYIDGDKGSTATDFSGEGHTLTENNATYDSAEKAWEFSSLSTSNVVSDDLGFEGDHPHSVSLWFNAANVSSNATLFHVGTAAGEGDAKTSISLTESGHLGWIDGGDNQFLSTNTWHNLVYATQGGGGVRTCYLDGRKLGDVSVQDTFGEYPPFAMSTYSDRGYTVSASSALSNYYPEHYAFDGNTAHASSANSWICAANKYDTTSGVARTDTAGLTTVDGDDKRGEWIQMEFPHKMVVDYVALAAQTDSEEYRAPKEGVIAGSNDGETWETMHVFTNQTSWTDNVFNNYVIDTNAGKGFKYVRIIIEKVQYDGTTSSTRQYTSLAEIKFYGHKENDTTRFPVSSTVLKYPHVAMTGPAQRGYVATNASNTHTGGTSIQYSSPDAYKVFNNVVGSYYFGLYDSGTNSPYVTTTGYWDTANYPDLKLSSSSGTPAGDWVSIEMPRKITLQSVEIAPRGGSSTSWSIGESARDFEIWATNDNSSWTRIHQTVDATAPTTGGEIRSFDINANVPYKRFALIVTRNGSTYPGAAGRPVIVLDVFNLYGTEEDLDVIARVGEGLDGKVANFRVYDKYLHEEQALELWDAQKDQFGRAESSVTFYKGHVGIGTTTPSAALTVMDEPGELVQLPPGNMTADDQYFEKHGVFRTRTSPGHITADYPPWEGFNDTIGTLWYTGYANSGPSYNGTNGAYSGTAQLGSTTKLGEYLVLEMPYKVFPKRMEYIRQSDGSHLITNAYVYGRNGSNGIWTEIGSFTDGGPPDDWVPKVVHLNNSEAYDQLAFVPTKRYAASTTAGVSCHLVRFFGTRERGQSTLHDGSLTLTKNLTVPRIGPAFDGWASQTPRRDHLVVEYDTSTYIHNNKAIDSSGNEIHGTFNNGAQYSRSEGAFTFDGVDDRITATLNNPSGAWVHSISLWVKPSANGGVYFTIGADATPNSTTIGVYDNGTSLNYYFFSNDKIFTYTPSVNQLHHIVMTYDGGSTISSRRMWVNGTELTTYTTGGTIVALNLGANAPLYIGLRKAGGTPFNGSISNFKLYDIALGPGEVRQLYEMGRNGPGNYMNIVDTAVAIGRHTPQAQLDVSGKIRANGANTNFTGQHRCSSADGSLEKGLVVSASKNTYRNITGGLTTGTKAITIDESLPVVSLSNVAQDKACFGVVSRMEEANTRTRSETIGGLVSEDSKVLGDNRVIVNSVGEGAIWVCDTNGPLESGDYITTSNVAGYGQKQTGEFLANYTVAKITMDCDFTASNVAVQAIKKVETLKTVTEDVWQGLSDYDRSSNTETQYINESNVVLSIEEYESLASEEQNTYSETTIQTYYRIQRGDNVLDEHGMLQWEDTGATEPGYELRYLDASGQQTDEANCVHRAAFVGCTYHCG